ncbi:MAG: integration host factor subunit alpha [Hydrogenophaga sp.]|uniref:integration host factor subunit alpha n=1 Tax=Hydrogenophaga sp. TaxID=1904254 RepID=UPI002ABC5BFF|nr:integration host factor subunit alpha [Hydrogenophaga sp.]MDZ4101007.1 integration host factor subunit alpha [Hydrogenophaga sp.]MDZ4239501.1 integration host factor subunit alpha [Hydrogenophaga sp.]
MKPDAPFVDSLEVPALTKATLISLVGEQLGLNGREAADMVEGFFELMQAGLCRGEDVKLAGFGSFEIHQKGARPGRNPKTGEEVQIAPRRVVKFSAGPKFKRRMKNEREAKQPCAPAPAGQALANEAVVVRPRSAFPEEARQPTRT